MSKIHVDIVSAEGEIYSGEAAMVFAPAQMGEVGIAPNHAPLLTGLKPGGVRVQPAVEGNEKAEELYFYVSGGVIEVQPKKITILADTAMRAKDLDGAAAEEARQRANELLKERTSAVEVATAQAELAAAAAQLHLLEKIRKATKGT
ncbi:MAG: F0F1 ATP synthase subunit epsilon [Chromatiales bacterium]|jgi:F-type H+-transporting ATPase subunit epsilon|nr:F0F1 ATP synthase subunit epsilon [Chromatiales bacterium]